MMETDRQKTEMEIAEVDEKIREKEEELGKLMAEIEVLKNEILEGVVMMEKGGMKKKERMKAEKKGKEDEMRLLQLEMEADEKNNEIERLKGEKVDLEENVKLVEQYLDRYYEELKEWEKRKRDLNGDDGQTKKGKTVSIFPN